MLGQPFWVVRATAWLLSRALSGLALNKTGRRNGTHPLAWAAQLGSSRPHLSSMPARYELSIMPVSMMPVYCAPHREGQRLTSSTLNDVLTTSLSTAQQRGRFFCGACMGMGLPCIVFSFLPDAPARCVARMVTQQQWRSHGSVQILHAPKQQ